MAIRAHALLCASGVVVRARRSASAGWRFADYRLIIDIYAQRSFDFVATQVAKETSSGRIAFKLHERRAKFFVCPRAGHEHVGACFSQYAPIRVDQGTISALVENAITKLIIFPKLSFAENAFVQSGIRNLKYFLICSEANRKSGNPVTMFITPDLIAKLRTIDKVGNPETIFIRPNSMAEVPTSSSSLRAIEKNRSEDWRLCRLARESSSRASEAPRSFPTDVSRVLLFAFM